MFAPAQAPHRRSWARPAFVCYIPIVTYRNGDGAYYKGELYEDPGLYI